MFTDRSSFQTVSPHNLKKRTLLANHAELIPKSISLLQNGQKVTIHGNGADIKRWVYVTDCSNAFNTIFHCGRPNATYNLGSHQAASNYNLCSTIIRSVVSRSKGQPSSSITVEVI